MGSLPIKKENKSLNQPMKPKMDWCGCVDVCVFGWGDGGAWGGCGCSSRNFAEKKSWKRIRVKRVSRCLSVCVCCISCVCTSFWIVVVGAEGKNRKKNGGKRLAAVEKNAAAWQTNYWRTNKENSIKDDHIRWRKRQKERKRERWAFGEKQKEESQDIRDRMEGVVGGGGGGGRRRRPSRQKGWTPQNLACCWLFSRTLATKQKIKKNRKPSRKRTQPRLGIEYSPRRNSVTTKN